MPRGWPAPAVHPRACGEHADHDTSVSFCFGSSPRLRGTYNVPPFKFRKARFIPALAGNIPENHCLLRSRSVHPRACGEHLPPVSAAPSAAGSSPRLRGTYQHERQHGGTLRFIPALAGNIAFMRSYAAVASVHPRACGEHHAADCGAVESLGSSPRLRGTFSIIRYVHFCHRFIPALAGNMPETPRRSWRRTVHPRACGEHSKRVKAAVKTAGSSPRLRGTSIPRQQISPGHRFIPALAGNISCCDVTATAAPVHPRACGEHFLVAGSTAQHLGSSPRLRGTSLAQFGADLLHRFIPALAGNIPTPNIVLHFLAVHPRACGEHLSSPRIRAIASGSSPRLRGTYVTSRQFLSAQRFIPALAGNIPAHVRGQACESVHPRACGEHTFPGADHLGRHGSSPRLRGTCNHGQVEQRVGRFIPALAGNM